MDDRLPKLRFPGLVRVDPAGYRPLVAAIRSEIETAGGHISFARFMERALYHPRWGYYRRAEHPVGRAGDYLTSPEIHPVFAAVLARQLAELWEILDRPRPFHVVEPGAGTGRLAADVRTQLSDTHPEAAAATLYVAVDVAPPRPNRPRPEAGGGERSEAAEGGARTSELRSGSVVSDRLPFRPGSVTGVILSNELLDAFPAHRLAATPEGWVEHRVTWDAGMGRFTWTEVPVSDERLLAPLVDVDPHPGQVVEVAPARASWIAEAAGVLRRGFILTLDYGDTAERLYRADRTDGTLRCFARHGVHSDPFKYVGEQDLTTDVDFSQLDAAGRGAGLETAAYVSQREWLSHWGVADIVEALAAEAFQSDENAANHQALALLLEPAGLGRIRCLVQARGVAPARLTGLHGPAPSDRRLTAEHYPRLAVHNPFAPLM